jgi:hypothetical protein
MRSEQMSCRGGRGVGCQRDKACGGKARKHGSPAEGANVEPRRTVLVIDCIAVGLLKA